MLILLCYLLPSIAISLVCSFSAAVNSIAKTVFCRRSDRDLCLHYFPIKAFVANLNFKRVDAVVKLQKKNLLQAAEYLACPTRAMSPLLAYFYRQHFSFCFYNSHQQISLSILSSCYAIDVYFNGRWCFWKLFLSLVSLFNQRTMVSTEKKVI